MNHFILLIKDSRDQSFCAESWWNSGCYCPRPDCGPLGPLSVIWPRWPPWKRPVGGSNEGASARNSDCATRSGFRSAQVIRSYILVTYPLHSILNRQGGQSTTPMNIHDGSPAKAWHIKVHAVVRTLSASLSASSALSRLRSIALIRLERLSALQARAPGMNSPWIAVKGLNGCLWTGCAVPVEEVRAGCSPVDMPGEISRASCSAGISTKRA